MMNENESRLRAAVAAFYSVTPDALHDGFALTTPEKQGSIARYALDAIVRRAVGVHSRAVYKVQTYGELQAAVLNGQSRPEVAAPARAPRQSATGTACGIDVQDVDALPDTKDFFAHSFYVSQFSKAEIAYCNGKENPRAHFAARWAAKEALKKCDPAFMPLDMNRIEIALDPSGAPRLRTLQHTDPVDLPHAVSLSHTANHAAAVVISVAPEHTEPRITAPGAVVQAGSSRAVAFAMIAALTALAMSLVAIPLALWD